MIKFERAGRNSENQMISFLNNPLKAGNIHIKRHDNNKQMTYMQSKLSFQEGHKKKLQRTIILQQKNQSNQCQK